MEDRKELLRSLANAAMEVWAIAHALSMEPAPKWAAVAAQLDSQVEALKAASADARGRSCG